MTASSDPIRTPTATKLEGTIASSDEDVEQRRLLSPLVSDSSQRIPDGKKPPNDEDDKDQEESDNNLRSTETSTASIPFKIFGARAKITSAVVFPSCFVQLASKVALGAVVTLYILNQQHILPRGLSSVVSKTLFWPTLPITFSKRIGKWSTSVDDTVVLGGAPFGWLNMPKKLHDEYGVRGVINMCEEYEGPTKQYKNLNMRELRLPTVDHFEPSLEDMKTAVAFIREYEQNNIGKVYVHCRAGHGKSAAIVLAWLMSKSEDLDSLDLEMLNSQLCELRDVRKTLFKQPNVNEFRSWLNLSGSRKKRVEIDESSGDEL